MVGWCRSCILFFVAVWCWVFSGYVSGNTFSRSAFPLRESAWVDFESARPHAKFCLGRTAGTEF